MRDLINLAATIIEATSAPPRGHLASRAVLAISLSIIVALCSIGAVVCGLTALWLYEAPILGEIGASLVVGAVLAAAALISGLILHAKAPPPPPPAPHPLIGLTSALLSGSLAGGSIRGGASSLMKSHKTLILLGAALAGFVASETQGRR